MDKLKELLSEEILNKGVDLSSYLGINEITWKYQDVLKVLDVIGFEQVTILGGDVYTSTQYIECTHDSWYFQESNQLNSSYSSVEKAKDYIQRYYKKNGDNFLYSLVLKN